MSNKVSYSGRPDSCQRIILINYRELLNIVSLTEIFINTQTSQNSFWELFHEARRNRLPAASDVYEQSARMYAEKRNVFYSNANPFLEKPVHPSYVIFYNKLYSQVQDVVANVLKGASPDIQERARKTFAFRLSDNATVSDLLATDVFRDKTVSMDVPVEASVNLMQKEAEENFIFLLNAYHLALHWPQRTEFLFLHELIVGYLGNLIQHGGELPERGAAITDAKSYWPVPAYMVRELALYLQRPEAELVALHFQSNAEVKNALPENILELFLISAHLTFYVDLLFPARGAANGLTTIYTSFFYPTLKKFSANPKLRLRTDAGNFTDQVLVHLLKEKDAKAYRPPMELILKNMFLKFTDEVWV